MKKCEELQVSSRILAFAWTFHPLLSVNRCITVSSCTDRLESKTQTSRFYICTFVISGETTRCMWRRFLTERSWSCGAESRWCCCCCGAGAAEESEAVRDNDGVKRRLEAGREFLRSLSAQTRKQNRQRLTTWVQNVIMEPPIEIWHKREYYSGIGLC